MSRSNPNVNAPNPAVRWFEWNGEHGKVRYYDKDTRKNVDVPAPFTFMLLDELASVRGWHDASQSGVFSNEVKDTRTDILVVKAFKAGTLIEGLYKDIKDRANALGGRFTANLYIAIQDTDEPSEPQWHIASIRFKGAALGAWMEFRKAIGRGIYSKQITIDGSHAGKKGRIVFHTPTFKAAEVSRADNDIAMDLDREFQEWLSGYFDRRTTDRVQPPADDDSETQTDDDSHSEPLTDDDIPF